MVTKVQLQVSPDLLSDAVWIQVSDLHHAPIQFPMTGSGVRITMSVCDLHQVCYKAETAYERRGPQCCDEHGALRLTSCGICVNVPVILLISDCLGKPLSNSADGS